MFTIQDYEDYAAANLPPLVWESLHSGADKDVTVKRNVEDFQNIRIIPRYYRDTSNVSTRVKILGTEVSMPIGISPTAAHKQFTPDGEIATVSAAQANNTVAIISIGSSFTLEEIAQRAPLAEKWMQLTLMDDMEVNMDLLQRVESAGYKAIVLTADMSVRPLRYHLLRNPQSSYYSAVNLKKYFKEEGWYESRQVTWETVKQFISKCKLPVLIKGILSPEDAKIARDVGASGIIVSNHGGRQLDCAISTIEALADIAKAVKMGGSPFFVGLDGGVRGGVDVFKAVAMGADFVFVGRPVLHGLSHSGQEGASHVLKILRHEFVSVMAQAGCCNVSEISSDYIRYKFH